jgi:hypothetical protein
MIQGVQRLHDPFVDLAVWAGHFARVGGQGGAVFFSSLIASSSAAGSSREAGSQMRCFHRARTAATGHQEFLTGQRC